MTSGGSASTTSLGSQWLQPVGNPGSWNLVLDSVFSGSTLPAPWSTGWFGSGVTRAVNSAETNCYDPSKVTMGGGTLSISASATPITCGGVTQPFSSGLVSTNGSFSFTYGYMEAMIWLPGNGSISDWPAFWADGQSWPTTGEIDVMEGLGGGACAHFHNSSGGPGACAPGASYAGGWHTFGADWEPGSLTFYYDGVKLWQDSSGITSAPMYLIMDLATTGGTANSSAATMQVAYVRVWQH
jgi:beta-glucanase (GH16 family)